jgi:hypothetical protein
MASSIVFLEGETHPISLKNGEKSCDPETRDEIPNGQEGKPPWLLLEVKCPEQLNHES